jgi:enamine deaminase RidA (YjgF/YER057c/UK114 family)
MTGHRIVNPPALPEPIGYAHAVVAAPGSTVHVGGQVGEGATLAEQYDAAAERVVEVLRACGAAPEDVVSLLIFTVDVPGYRASLRELGAAHRRHFGRHYPATSLVGVTSLFEESALVELVATAVVADRSR